VLVGGYYITVVLIVASQSFQRRGDSSAFPFDNGDGLLVGNVAGGVDGGNVHVAEE
jgi:hypothetical protein